MAGDHCGPVLCAVNITQLGVGNMDENAENPENIEEPKPAEPQKAAEASEPKQQETSKDARMWAMFCHLIGMGWLVVPFIGGVIGSLVLWQIKKDEFAFVDEQGKEALNFQISMLIYAAVSMALVFICVGMFLFPLVAVVDMIFALIAAVKANNGEHYRYPLTIRFVK